MTKSEWSEHSKKIHSMKDFVRKAHEKRMILCQIVTKNGISEKGNENVNAKKTKLQNLRTSIVNTIQLFN